MACQHEWRHERHHAAAVKSIYTRSIVTIVCAMQCWAKQCCASIHFWLSMQLTHTHAERGDIKTCMTDVASHTSADLWLFHLWNRRSVEREKERTVNVCTLAHIHRFIFLTIYADEIPMLSDSSWLDTTKATWIDLTRLYCMNKNFC